MAFNNRKRSPEATALWHEFVLTNPPVYYNNRKRNREAGAMSFSISTGPSIEQQRRQGLLLLGGGNRT